MAKDQSPQEPSPQKPDPEQDPGELPTPAYAPPENVKIGPLDPPPPKDGGETTRE